MKTRILLLSIVLTLFFNIKGNGQIVTNGNFTNGINGWTITGNNLSIALTRGTINIPNSIEVINTTNANESFVLNSPPFSLLANEVYDLSMIYGHYASSLGGGLGIEYITRSQISSVGLKDSQGNIVKIINLTNCNTSAGLNGPQIYSCGSNNFTVSASGAYSIEIISSMGSSNSNNLGTGEEYFIFDKKNQIQRGNINNEL